MPQTTPDNLPEHKETVADSHTKPSTDTMATELQESASSESGNGPIDTPPEDTSMADPEDSQFSGLKRSHASDSDSDQNLRQQQNKIDHSLTFPQPDREEAIFKTQSPLTFWSQNDFHKTCLLLFIFSYAAHRYKHSRPTLYY